MVASISVLCVDDESATLEVVGTHLERCRPSFDVQTAHGPDAAEAAVTRGSIDCVVADYEMEGVDGLELMERLRNHQPGLPYIIYTGRGSEEVAAEAISAGVTDYLRKGVHADQYEVLANRIENAAEVRRIEEAKAASEQELERYRTLVETIGDPMYVLDGGGVCQLANEALAEYTGYGRDDLEGTHFSRFISEDQYEEASDRLVSMTDSERSQATIEIALDTVSGETKYAEAKIAPITTADGGLNGSVGVLRDISARKERNRELSQFETIVETVPLGIVVLDELANVKWTNERFSEATEWSLEEIEGRQFLDFVEEGYLDEGVVEQYLEHVRSLLSSESDDEVAVYDLEVRTYAGDVRFYEAHTALLPLDDGEYQGTVTAFLDISTRHRYQQELERQNDRLEQFARFVSHDLRNPINVAQGHIDMLRTELEDPPDQLDEVAWAVGHMETLIEDLLSMARQGKTIEETEPVDFETIVEESWNGVDTAGASLSVEDSMTLEADYNRMRELLENLFRNAVEHGGTDVTVTASPLEWENVSSDGSVGPGFYVEDDGTGFHADDADLFEFGFTTAEDGTGFGLGIVKQIAEAHGWSVTATAAESGGARFEFREVTGTAGD